MPEAPLSKTPAWRRLRWRYAGAAFLLGVAYTLGALLLGFQFRLGDRDFTLAAGALVEVSFAGFGYLLGLVSEARSHERSAAEAAAAQQRELARIRSRLAQAEKLAALGELASTISHEVRNPLAILRSMVQNLEERLEDAADRVSCQTLLEEIDRLGRVTTRLVDFAKPMELVRTEISVPELVERASFLAEELLRGRTTRLEIDPGRAGVLLEADPDLLCQVLLGLLENAAEASPDGSAIELGWEEIDERGGWVELRVADRGPGVPEDLQQRIFEPFFTTRTQGHGLGLAVARQIVEAHGGQLVVENRPGGGAMFCARLPKARALEVAA